MQDKLDQLKKELVVLKDKIKNKKDILSLPSDKLAEKMEASRAFQSMLEGWEVPTEYVIDMLKDELAKLKNKKDNMQTQIDNLIAMTDKN